MIEFTNQLNTIRFPTHRCFNLYTSSWGSAPPQDIVQLLDSVVLDFYSNLDIDKITVLPVYVKNTLESETTRIFPERIKLSDHVIIFLTSQDLSWCQYSYQFAHELCHHVIDIDFPPKNDKFGWLEESICELASLYTLKKMSFTWRTNPPYTNWANYSVSINNYVHEILSDPKHKLEIPFCEWLNNILLELYSDRCKRTENKIIAMRLLTFFTRTPELWETIQYLRKIIVTDEMTLTQYLLEWKNVIPSTLQSEFDNIINIFINN